MKGELPRELNRQHLYWQALGRPPMWEIRIKAATAALAATGDAMAASAAAIRKLGTTREMR